MNKQTEYTTKSTLKKVNQPLAIGVVSAVVALSLGFVGGMQYQKSKATNSVADANTAATNGFGQFGGNGQMPTRMPGGFGEVTAVSSTSITVTETRSGTETTYTINDQTTVTEDNAAAEVSSIEKGDTVMIRTSSSDSKLATQITINPQVPSGGGFRGDNSQVQTN